MSTEAVVTTDERRGWTSASNAQADSVCVGRHLAQSGMKSTDTDDSVFGDQIHEALAKDDPSKLDHEQLVIYERMVEIRDKAMETVFGPDAKRAKVMKEHRMWVKVRPNPEAQNNYYQHSGQVDFLAYFERKGLIVEYKSLPGDVAGSPKNHQLRDQVALASGFLMLSEVVVVVNQPLVTMSPELCVYTSEDIKAAEREMFQRVIASNQPDGKRTPHPVACKFCLAKPKCPDYARWMDSMLPDNVTPFATPVENWSEEQKMYFLKVRSSLKKWIEYCEDKLKLELKQNPNAITGWGLKPGKNRSAINDPNELFRRFVELARPWATKQNAEMHADHVLMPHFMKCITVKKEGLTDLVRMVTDLKGKKLDSAVELLTDGIVTKSNDAPSIAPKL